MGDALTSNFAYFIFVYTISPENNDGLILPSPSYTYTFTQ
jgi:hypothetical protein